MSRRRSWTRGLAAGAALVAASAAVRGQEDCSLTSRGFVPLVDLGAGAYLGSQGGLYPGGADRRPAAHEAAGIALARDDVAPRDAAGNPDPANGKIGFVSLGMSNTTDEFSSFMTLAGQTPGLHPKLVLVDGAQPGKAVEQWKDPADSAWSVFAGRLSAAGVAPAQVQVVWLDLCARYFNFPDQTFPTSATQLRDWIAVAVRNLTAAYPSVRIVLLSSRTYGGYAAVSLNPEPFAYETGFAVKWLVEEQISGDASLAWSGAARKAPWMCWGPYFWADGLGADGVVGGVPGRADGLEWLCSDFISDGLHETTQGRAKCAQMLMDFLEKDAVSRPWFLADGRGGAWTKSTLAPDRTNVPADGVSAATLTLTPRDETDAPLGAGHVVEFEFLGAPAGALGAATDRGDGSYEARLTAPLSPGVAVVTARADGAVVGVSTSVTFDAVVTPPPPPLHAVTSVTPTSLSLGTSLVVSGRGFGPRVGGPQRPPRAWLSLTLPGRAKPTKIPLRVSATPTATATEFAASLVSVPRGAVGPVALFVLPYGGDAKRDLLSFAAGLAVEAPSIASFDPPSAKSGDVVTISGRFFGARRGRVRFVQTNATTGRSVSASAHIRPRSWTDANDAAGDVSTVSVVVPRTAKRRLQPGVVQVRIENGVASSDAGAFTILAD